jgi:TM2 domain-containing membrane protein YozV
MRAGYTVAMHEKGTGRRMKLNFWQWIGILLLIVGAAWWLYDWSHPKAQPGPTPVPPTTQNVKGA